MEQEVPITDEPREAPTVYIIDSDEACRDSMVASLRATQIQAEAFSDPHTFLRSYHLESPGCLVLELSFPNRESIRLLETLNRQKPRLPVIAITRSPEIREVVNVMKLGALDVLEKPFPPGQLHYLIQAAMKLDQAHREKWRKFQAAQQCLEKLTPDEKAVLSEIIAGRHNKGIASVLDIGLRTVQARRASIMKKMESNTVAELVHIVLAAQSQQANILHEWMLPTRLPEETRS